MITDSIIGFFSPKQAYERMRYRRAGQVIREHSRKYNAAGSGRRTDGWNPTSTSVNSENLLALKKLRDRSREEERNNAYARRALQAIKNNTIGTGIRPTPSTGKDDIKTKVKEAWWKWAETTACDYDSRETFYGLQKLVLHAVARDGEVLIRKRRVTSPKMTCPVQLQICEVDFIDDGKDVLKTDGDGWIMQGVEFDAKGKKKGYWLYDRHPSDAMNMSSKFVPESEVLHIFIQDRPGQVRGVPWLHSVLLKLKDFDDFEDAQLMQQKIAACFAAFVTKEADDGDTTNITETSERVEPGIIEHLKPGEEITFSSPPTTTGQDTYSKKVLQAIASGIGLSYEALTGDLSNVNFSSGRMGWLEFHRNVQEWQDRMMIPQFCDPVWKWFIEGIGMKGTITSNTEVYADWTPPRREMIDPTKEITGLSSKVLNGFDSWQNVVRQLGGDPELLLQQLTEDNAKFDKAGVKLACDGRNTSKSNTNAKGTETSGNAPASSN